MIRLKIWLTDFPTQGASAAVAVSLIFLTGLVVIGRLAYGARFPEGYEPWFVLLGALSGVSTVGMIGKRLSNIEYKAAGSQPPQVNVERANTVNAEGA